MAAKSDQYQFGLKRLETLTNHACQRMSGRAINQWQIEQVMSYGRETHARNAVIYAVGRKEIKEHGRFLEPCEGIHVLCSPRDGAIFTTYRNQNLSRMKH